MDMLLFKSPSFRDGINVTVRLGYKWRTMHSAALAQFGRHDVLLAETGNEHAPIGRARIESVMPTVFRDLHNEWLQAEHDPSCVTFGGLYDAMREAYGDAFNVNSEVAVVFFRPLPDAVDTFESAGDDPQPATVTATSDTTASAELASAA